MQPEEELYRVRLNKLEKIRKLGINPYPYRYETDSNTKEIKEKYKDIGHEKSKEKVKIAGRIVAIRDMGKICFMHLQDFYGRIQIYFKKEELEEKERKLVDLLDIGDIIGIEGNIFRTKKGEITLWVSKLTLLTKALKPLPEKWHGLKDKEIRYRKRYLDLIANPDVKNVFILRAKIISLIREFLNNKGFIEVETPSLQPVYGGALARPFKTHLNALNKDLYLRISPELYLKRLIIGGFDKVYEIGKNFRNEGIDATHNPEFISLELYQAYADYNDMMNLAEELIEFLVKKIFGKTKIIYQNKEIDFKRPWKRLTMKKALKDYANIDIDKLNDKELFRLVEENEINYEGELTRGKAMEFLFEHLVEDKLIQPTFIIDYPKESTSLCKLHRKNPELIERFEAFIAGIEMINAYSELNDPKLQEKFLKEQQKEQEIRFKEPMPLDTDFIEALEYGMPPTGGLGLGIDRLVMILSNVATIKDVIFFPFMK